MVLFVFIFGKLKFLNFWNLRIVINSWECSFVSAQKEGDLNKRRIERDQEDIAYQ